MGGEKSSYHALGKALQAHDGVRVVDDDTVGLSDGGVRVGAGTAARGNDEAAGRDNLLRSARVLGEEK